MQMNDKVLSDDEKDALLEGVENGQVEVHSGTGTTYASVVPFQIPPRARIVTDSFPRLQVFNQQIADKLNGDVKQLLQCDVEVTSRGTSVASFEALCEQHGGLAAAIEFDVTPLSGRAMLLVEGDMVRLLVDAFFGGSGNSVETTLDDGFTNGELSVANLFSTVFLTRVKESWSAFQEISGNRLATEVGIELAEIAEPGEAIICCEFEIAFSEMQSSVRLLWPKATLQPLLPFLEGQKSERNAAEDARWSGVLRRSIADTAVSLTSSVGHLSMALGELIDAEPGDVIPITNPQAATVAAKSVSLLQGRLGVHQGKNAIETTNWITQA